MADGTVKVLVKAADDTHEVSVEVPAKASLTELKQALARAIDRPEVMQGRFLMIMPNGDRKPILEAQKLGPRRNLFFEGAPLYPKPKELPVLSLDDFDPRDEECIIESPRTLKACELEGVDPEELFYVPPRAYADPGLPKRLIRLRHQFFEAFRQDTVEIVRRTRERIKGEDPSTWDGTATHFGGNWGGALAPHMYPLTHSYFEELKSTMTLEKLYERPKALPGASGGGNRWAPGGPTKWEVDPDKPPHIMMYLTSKDADLDTDVVEWACEDCGDNLKQLLRLPAGNAEQVIGLPKRCQNMVNAQIPADQKVMRRAHRNRKDIVKKQVAIAEAQIDSVNWHCEDLAAAHATRLERFKSSAPPCETEMQRINTEFARKREDYWRSRREAVHLAQLDAEDARNELLRDRGEKDNERERRVANMRALTKVHFARTWTDRRTSWGRNHQSVNKGMEAFNAALLHKHEEAAARVEGQRQRMQCLIDFKREFKFLRKALTDMAADRERRKQDARRKAISEEFSRMADEAESSGPGSPSRSMFASRSLGSPSMSASVRSVSSSGSPTRKRGPRFDFGRFGAEALTSPVASRSMMRNTTGSMSETALTRTMGRSAGTESQGSRPSVRVGSS